MPTFDVVDEESRARHRPPSPIEWLIEESVLEPRVQPRPPSPLEWLGGESLLDENGEPTGEVPVAAQPEPTPRRHRRAAEPDDEAGDDLGVTGSAWSVQASSASASSESASYESSAAVGSSYDGSAYDELLFGSSPVASSYSSTSAHETPSYETPAYENPSYESSSYEMSSEPTAYGSTSYASGSDDTPAWSTGSSTWLSDTPVAPEETTAGSGYGSTTSYDASGYASADSGTDEPARRSPEVQGHARLEQILSESGVEAPSGGRSRRRRYRDEGGETAGDDVLARVLGRN
jgi:hypothetical protein